MCQEGGRELARIKNCVDASIQSLEECIKKTKEKPTTMAAEGQTEQKQKQEKTKQKGETNFISNDKLLSCTLEDQES